MEKLEIKSVIRDFTSDVIYIKTTYASEMEDEKFNEVLIKSVKKCIEMFDESKDDYEEFFSENIEKEFVELLNTENMDKEDKLIKFLSNPILTFDTFKNCRRSINKIGEFIISNNLEYTVDQYVDLIKENAILNEILKNFVSTVANSNIKDKESLLEKDITNDISQNLIYLYIDQYEIEFEEGTEKSEEIHTESVVKDYLNELKSNPKRYGVISKEESFELFRAYKNGNKEAKKALVEHNLRLVISIAKRHLNKGLEFEDLIQEGNIGLMTSIDKFDIRKDVKFSTYATWWIRQAITRAVDDKGKAIRIPVHRNEQIQKYNHAVAAYVQRNATTPTDEELMEILGWDKTTLENVRTSIQNVVSLDAPTKSDDEDCTLKDMIASTDAPVSEDAEQKSMVLEVRKALDNAAKYQTLTEKEHFILIRRYGLFDEKPATLEELGQELGITRERVRQIQKSAEKMLLKFMIYYPEFCFASKTEEFDDKSLRLKVKRRNLLDIRERLEFIKKNYYLFDKIDLDQLILKLS